MPKPLTHRELDAEVAERGMQWPIFDGSAHETGSRPYPHGWRRRFGRWDGDVYDGETNFKFNPSENVADAYRAIDSVRALGVRIWVKACHDGYIIDGAYGPNIIDFQDGADTLAEVPGKVCAAILKCLDVKYATLGIAATLAGEGENA